MKAYKATYDMKCRDFTYEVGKTYTFDGKLEMCIQGFHFCKKIDDVLEFYSTKPELKILEIECEEVESKDTKSITDKLEVLRVIPISEWNNLFVNYQFDEKGNKTSSKNSAGYERFWTYDDKGNKTSYKSSNGYEWSIDIT